VGWLLSDQMDDQVIAVLDAICNQGCDYVDSCIEILAAGGNPEQSQVLSEQQRQSLLDELQAIMAVYHVRKG
jgi:hypothetical protein